MSTNHPTLSNNQSELQIHLDNDTLIMHGSQQESSGCVLRGHVRLNLKEATKFKSITLRLVGKIKVAWSESTTSSSPQKFHKEERTIINKECSFLPTRRNQAHQLSAQQHRWDFEFALPGNLPDSIENNDTGSVQYRLKAIAERPTFLLNYTDKKSVRIVRHVLPSNTEWFSPMTITNEWANKLEYHISVPSKVFTEDETIPVNLRIVPKLPGLKVRYLTCTLKEYVTYSAGNNNQFSKTEGRIVQFFRDEQFPSRGDVWQKTQRIKVPRCPSGVQFDTKNELIRIRHKLKFTMSLINSDKHISELRAALPVIICPISQRTEENSLPAYEEALRAVPYFDTSEFNYSSGDSAAGSPVEERAALFETTEAADRAVQYLHQQWAASLNRVPSYRTALRDRLARPTSLPSYDSLCVM
ncbi:hypothetical protein INT44_003425 [Umbelopsis vinacea]|uniref:Arrestin C-terminal-like domain-containing protein n=1 Tax=Umbelopsis vinacea TaxID=44442 RepID=A0A8H7PWE5_9FUNG|nr:hypothetical protein INT44_003425 [Umbelopsis vinacea]